MDDKLKPKLFSVMKTYTKEQFIKDIVAGIIVAIIALPLSIALAIASGVGPEQGLYTAIVAGFIISFLGGSRVQIAGPTAAFATIVAGIVAKNGMAGLAIATIMAGIILIIMGIFRFGNLIKFIPFTITTGFTAGIAVTIAIGQLKDFFGITYKEGYKAPIETIDKAKALAEHITRINLMALLIGIIALVILIVWPYINKVIPGSLIAVIVGSAIVKISGIDVLTIGDLYPDISSTLPHFSIPAITFDSVRNLLPDAFTIAILAGIESLLSCVVSDGMIGSRHRSNMELVAQGAGNIASALFGGIPATGAIARTAANVKNGGRTPIAGMVHSVVLLLILIVLMPFAKLIPMPVIAAILIMVAYNMSGIKTVGHILKRAPKSDIFVLIVTFILTVVFDLVVAIGVGLVLSSFLFMKRMSDVTDIKDWKYIEDIEKNKEDNKNFDEENDKDSLRFKAVPKNTFVYEITGPLFFGASGKLSRIMDGVKADVVIIRMRSVPALDSTAVNTLENMINTFGKNKTKLIFSHVNEQPYAVLKKAGIVERIGEECFCKNIDEALLMAETFTK